MNLDLPREQIHLVLDQMVEELLNEARISRPPVDAFAVSRRLGLVVARDAACPTRGRLVRVPVGSGRRGTILLAEEQRREREQWSLSHEIGEACMHQIVARLGVDTIELESGHREQLASQFAQALLLPYSWFARWGKRLAWDLPALKQVFSTASHELQARRMLDMQPAVILTMFDHGRLVWRYCNFRHPPPLIPDEKEAWEITHQTGNVVHDFNPTLDQVREICCWPVHEPNWKREILRTEIEDW